MDLGISGRWALVCGASKGLGLGCAQALVQEGVNVLIVARGEPALKAAQAQLKALNASVDVLALAADITSAAGRDAVFALHKDFDIVVTNAGGPPMGNFQDWERDDWIKAIDANMLTPIELIKATIEGMAERGFGRIVNITSSAVKAPISTLGLSNGARSGLTGFVAGVAREQKYAAKGVTINSLLPGPFDTDRLRTNFQNAADKSGQTLEAVMQARMKTNPTLRFGNSAEFGAICAFLCSQQAGYINGQNVLADGGAYPGTY